MLSPAAQFALLLPTSAPIVTISTPLSHTHHTFCLATPHPTTAASLGASAAIGLPLLLCSSSELGLGWALARLSNLGQPQVQHPHTPLLHLCTDAHTRKQSRKPVVSQERERMWGDWYGHAPKPAAAEAPPPVSAAPPPRPSAPPPAGPHLCPEGDSPVVQLPHGRHQRLPRKGGLRKPRLDTTTQTGRQGGEAAGSGAVTCRVATMR